MSVTIKHCIFHCVVLSSFGLTHQLTVHCSILAPSYWDQTYAINSFKFFEPHVHVQHMFLTAMILPLKVVIWFGHLSTVGIRNPDMSGFRMVDLCPDFKWYKTKMAAYAIHLSRPSYVNQKFFYVILAGFQVLRSSACVAELNWACGQVVQFLGFKKVLAKLGGIWILHVWAYM